MTKQATEDYIIHKNGRTFKSRKVGFIGLGKMGSAMAGHLARAGHIVHVFNRSKKKADNWIKAFESYSVSEINSLDLMGQACEIIISCVGDDDDLRDITFSPTGCFQTMQKNTIFIDHSTTSFDVVQEVNRFAVERGISFFDAPVSGGTSGAKNGVLSIMFGGQKEQSKSFKDIVSPYSKTAERMGEVGSGQLAKMVNQICISGLIQGLAEGLKFGLDSGLDMKTVLSVISKGAAQSWQMENRGNTMLEGKYDFGFAVDHMIKDLSIVLEQGVKQNSDLEITKHVKEFYKDLSNKGHGNLDTSALLLRLTSKEFKQ